MLHSIGHAHSVFDFFENCIVFPLNTIRKLKSKCLSQKPFYECIQKPFSVEVIRNTAKKHIFGQQNKKKKIFFSFRIAFGNDIVELKTQKVFHLILLTYIFSASAHHEFFIYTGIKLIPVSYFHYFA